MKKLMAILAAISLVIPFANAKAEEGITQCSVSESCFVYTVGDEVNFYRSEEERKQGGQNAGITSIILEDEGKGSQYVKVLALGMYGTSTPYYDSKAENTPASLIKKNHIAYLGLKEQYYWTSARQDADGAMELEYISLNELITIFGAKDNGNGTYTIDADKWGEFFVKSAVGKYGSKGFYTSTYDTATNKVWAVEYTLNSTKDKITAMTVKQVSMVDEGAYAYLPVVSFDKSYDCHTRVSIEEMACYSCDDDYKWLTVGTQAPTCTLIEDIKSKGTCVKSVKTGVEDYIVEFVAVALVCGIALVVVKRKELFRGI